MAKARQVGTPHSPQLVFGNNLKIASAEHIKVVFGKTSSDNEEAYRNLKSSFFVKKPCLGCLSVLLALFDLRTKRFNK